MQYISLFEFDSCIFTNKGKSLIRKGETIHPRKLHKYTLPYEMQRFNKIIHDIGYLKHKHLIIVAPPCIPYVKAYINIRGMNGVNIVNVRKSGREKFVGVLKKQGFEITT
jgi:hypothetical protein